MTRPSTPPEGLDVRDLAHSGASASIPSETEVPAAARAAADLKAQLDAISFARNNDGSFHWPEYVRRPALQAMAQIGALERVRDTLLESGGANWRTGRVRFSVWNLHKLSLAFDLARDTVTAAEPGAVDE